MEISLNEKIESFKRKKKKRKIELIEELHDIKIERFKEYKDIPLITQTDIDEFTKVISEIFSLEQENVDETYIRNIVKSTFGQYMNIDEINNFYDIYIQNLNEINEIENSNDFDKTSLETINKINFCKKVMDDSVVGLLETYSTLKLLPKRFKSMLINKDVLSENIFEQIKAYFLQKNKDKKTLEELSDEIKNYSLLYSIFFNDSFLNGDFMTKFNLFSKINVEYFYLKHYREIYKDFEYTIDKIVSKKISKKDFYNDLFVEIRRIKNIVGLPFYNTVAYNNIKESSDVEKLNNIFGDNANNSIFSKLDQNKYNKIIKFFDKELFILIRSIFDNDELKIKLQDKIVYICENIGLIKNTKNKKENHTLILPRINDFIEKFKLEVESDEIIDTSFSKDYIKQMNNVSMYQLIINLYVMAFSNDLDDNQKDEITKMIREEVFSNIFVSRLLYIIGDINDFYYSYKTSNVCTSIKIQAVEEIQLLNFFMLLNNDNIDEKNTNLPTKTLDTINEELKNIGLRYDELGDNVSIDYQNIEDKTIAKVDESVKNKGLIYKNIEKQCKIENEINEIDFTTENEKDTATEELIKKLYNKLNKLKDEEFILKAEHFALESNNYLSIVKSFKSIDEIDASKINDELAFELEYENKSFLNFYKEQIDTNNRKTYYLNYKDIDGEKIYLKYFDMFENIVDKINENKELFLNTFIEKLYMNK